jgi:hypothetical protein
MRNRLHIFKLFFSKGKNSPVLSGDHVLKRGVPNRPRPTFGRGYKSLTNYCCVCKVWYAPISFTQKVMR